MNGYRGYHEDSDADDEYDRDLKSPNDQGDFPSSPTESDGAEHTPRMGAPFPSPTGSILRWSADQTADFIANLGYEQYADAFIGRLHQVLLITQG